MSDFQVFRVPLFDQSSEVRPEPVALFCLRHALQEPAHEASNQGGEVLSSLLEVCDRHGLRANAPAVPRVLLPHGVAFGEPPRLVQQFERDVLRIEPEEPLGVQVLIPCVLCLPEFLLELLSEGPLRTNAIGQLDDRVDESASREFACDYGTSIAIQLAEIPDDELKGVLHVGVRGSYAPQLLHDCVVRCSFKHGGNLAPAVAA
ncbi:MAG: hypothetical protein M0R75_11735 [Dehalococcoidia bacterium]|nr:hypothetical protein [Dehalococcoidia bacterium]